MTADIRSLRGERGLVSAAKLAVLNLESTKAVLGAKWQRLEALVCALFEGAIKASLEPGDVHVKSGELGYIVIYHRLSLREAQSRCAELSRQVCRRLFAEGHIELAIRTVVGHVDRNLLRTSSNMMAAIDQSLEQHGKKTLIVPGRRRSAGVPAARAQQARAVSGPESNLSFAYRPIWDCASRSIFAWLCQPSPRDRPASPLAAADMASLSTEDADCALLDRTILAHCAKHMERLHRDGARLSLAVPIHASTLSRPRAWSLFGEIYRPIPPAILRELVFVVFGLDAVPDTRLGQELSKLSGARHLFCVAEARGDLAARFAHARAHAIGIDVQGARSRGKSSAELIASVAADARQNGQQAFILGLASPRRAVSALAAGVRYLEGAAIHPMVSDPRRGLVRELDNLPVPHPA